MTDQAASLRAWAAEKGVNETPQPTTSAEDVMEDVVVIGMSRHDKGAAEKALKVFARWESEGKKWIKDSRRWRMHAVPSDYSDIQRLVGQYKRWALWVDGDIDGFSRAYNALKKVAMANGPCQVLALHEPMSRQGLLNNLQQIAKLSFAIELLVFADERICIRQTES